MTTKIQTLVFAGRTLLQGDKMGVKFYTLNADTREIDPYAIHAFALKGFTWAILGRVYEIPLIDKDTYSFGLRTTAEDQTYKDKEKYCITWKVATCAIKERVKEKKIAIKVQALENLTLKEIKQGMVFNIRKETLRAVMMYLA